MYSCASLAEARGCPIRKFTDQSLFAAPRNLSQRTTSFIASQCQGIHQMLLVRLITLIINVHPFPWPQIIPKVKTLSSLMPDVQPRQIGRTNIDGLWKDLFSLVLIVLRSACHRGGQTPESRSTRAHRQIPSFTMSISDTRTFYSGETGYQAGQACPGVFIMGNRLGWWRQTGSNRRPEACKATALPTELCPRQGSVIRSR